MEHELVSALSNINYVFISHFDGMAIRCCINVANGIRVVLLVLQLVHQQNIDMVPRNGHLKQESNSP